jgi:hypothetical protein
MPKLTSPAVLLTTFADQPDEAMRKVQVRLPFRSLRPAWRWGERRGCRSETDVFERILEEAFPRREPPFLRSLDVVAENLSSIPDDVLLSEARRRGWIVFQSDIAYRDWVAHLQKVFAQTASEAIQNADLSGSLPRSS